MRNILYLVVLVGLCAQTLATPFVGPIVYYWVTFMALHTETYAAFQPALVIGAVTGLAYVFSRRDRSIHWSGPTLLLVVFYAWTTFTTPFALVQPEAGWAWFDWTKVVAMVLLTVALVREKHHILALVWINVICWAYWSAKGGLFVVLYGGKFDLQGPDGAYLSNNDFARALMMALPFFYALAVHAASRLVRWGVVAGGLGTMMALIATNSLGALVGVAAMVGFFVVTSRRPFKLAFVGVILAGLLVWLLPPERIEAAFGETDRLESVESDSSMATRFRMWGFAIDMANKRPLTGGGFEIKEIAGRSAHSNYFQVLGEHGYLGLMLYLALCASVLVALTKTVHLTRFRPQLYWARDIALMSRLSVIGYLAGGLTINHGYKEIFYVVVGLSICLDRYVRAEIAEGRAPLVAPSKRAAIAPARAPREVTS